MTYLVLGMIYTAYGEMIPDRTRVIKIHPDLEWDTRGLVGFLSIYEYESWLGRPTVNGEIGMIGNCLISVSNDDHAIKDFQRVKNIVRHRRPAPTLADSSAQAF